MTPKQKALVVEALKIGKESVQSELNLLIQNYSLRYPRYKEEASGYEAEIQTIKTAIEILKDET